MGVCSNMCCCYRCETHSFRLLQICSYVQHIARDCCGVGWVKIKLKICASTVAHHSFKSSNQSKKNALFCSKLSKCLKTFNSNKSSETATGTVKRTNRAERAWLGSKFATQDISWPFAGDCEWWTGFGKRLCPSGGVHWTGFHRRLWVVDRLSQETVSLAMGDGTLYTSTSEVEAGRLSRIGLRW